MYFLIILISICLFCYVISCFYFFEYVYKNIHIYIYIYIFIYLFIYLFIYIYIYIYIYISICAYSYIYIYIYIYTNTYDQIHFLQQAKMHLNTYVYHTHTHTLTSARFADAFSRLPAACFGVARRADQCADHSGPGSPRVKEPRKPKTSRNSLQTEQEIAVTPRNVHSKLQRCLSRWGRGGAEPPGPVGHKGPEGHKRLGIFLDGRGQGEGCTGES